MYSVKVFNVVLGNTCTMSCAHCAPKSHPGDKARISDQDIRNIHDALPQLNFETLMFTGGEPTLFIDELNRIIQLCMDAKGDSFRVSITSNGWYGKNENRTRELLGRITNLNKLQLSFDEFHEQFINAESLKKVVAYCHEKRIDCCVLSCIREPKDIIKLKEYESELGVPVSYQPVAPVEKAVENGVCYKHLTFDVTTWGKKCPNIGTISFFPGFGFTICCSSLINHKNHFSKISNADLGAYLNSEFHSDISSKTFSEIATKDLDGIKVVPTDSHECGLCEKVYLKKWGVESA